MPGRGARGPDRPAPRGHGASGRPWGQGGWGQARGRRESPGEGPEGAGQARGRSARGPTLTCGEAARAGAAEAAVAVQRVGQQRGVEVPDVRRPVDVEDGRGEQEAAAGPGGGGAAEDAREAAGRPQHGGATTETAGQRGRPEGSAEARRWRPMGSGRWRMRPAGGGVGSGGAGSGVRRPGRCSAAAWPPPPLRGAWRAPCVPSAPRRGAAPPRVSRDRDRDRGRCPPARGRPAGLCWRGGPEAGGLAWSGGAGAPCGRRAGSLPLPPSLPRAGRGGPCRGAGPVCPGPGRSGGPEPPPRWAAAGERGRGREPRLPKAAAFSKGAAAGRAAPLPRRPRRRGLVGENRRGGGTEARVLGSRQREGELRSLGKPQVRWSRSAGFGPLRTPAGSVRALRRGGQEAAGVFCLGCGRWCRLQPAACAANAALGATTTIALFRDLIRAGRSL